MSDEADDEFDVRYMHDMLTPARGSRNTRPVNLIYSAHVGINAELFPDVLKLHVKDGARVADVTYGRGVFWKFVAKDRYQTSFSDLNTGSDSETAKVRRADCRKLPYENQSFDAVILDPPYMHVSGGTAYESIDTYETFYRNNEVEAAEGTTMHEAVLALYSDAGKEAARILKKKGVLIVKCQDEICCHKMRLTHMEIIEDYKRFGLECDDLFVLVSTNNPGVSRMKKQYHSRRNHSYFVCFRRK